MHAVVVAAGWVGAVSTSTTFEQRLRQAIGDRPVDRVARLAHMSRTNLRRMLKGETKNGPRTDTVAGLAEILEVDPGWLAFGPPNEIQADPTK